MEIPLVLHGGSGISPSDFRKAISLGIAKINIYTSMTEAAIQATTSYIQTIGTRYNDYPLMVNSMKESIAAVVEKHMEIFGSAGKASVKNS